MTRYLFLTLALLIVSGGHFYLARRLFWSNRALTVGARRLGSAMILALGAVAVAVMVLPRAEITWLNQPLIQWTGYLWIGAFSLLMTLVLLRDLVWLIASLCGLFGPKREATEALNSAPPNAPAGGLALSRRELFHSVSNAAVLGTAGLGVARGVYNARATPAIKRTEIALEGLPRALEGFRIVQLSDLHVGPTIKREFVERVVLEVNAQSPDLIAITGDLVDGTPAQLLGELEPLKGLRAPHGVFYVTGNHEYYWGAQAWLEAASELNMVALANAHRVIEHRGAKLVIAGVNDYSAERHIPEHASDPAAALLGAPQDAAITILLAHQPKSIHAASRAGFDLQLSGHTHGGQFYPWNLVVGLAHPFSVGLGKQDNTQIYVSRGTGYWGTPIRLGAPSEISELILRRG